METSYFFVPNYIHETFTEGGIVLWNTANDATIQLEKQDLPEYYALKQKGTGFIQTEMEKVFYEEEILVNSSKQFEQYMYCVDQLKNTLFLVIMPTEACNFRCIYCYEHHDAVTMSRQTIDGVKIFLGNVIANNSFSQIEVSWFGGEPTLCLNTIEEIMHFIRDTACEGTKIDSTITTNGYLLTRDNFVRLLECGVTSYQLTLDGFRHDEKRFLVDGSKTLEVILNNLYGIHSLGSEYRFDVMIRNNILSGDNDFKWYDFLKSKFGDDERFTYSVVSVVKLGGKRDDEFEVETSDDLERAHLDYLESIGLRVVPMLANYPLGGVCFAAYPYGYLIRPDGTLGKCTVELYDPLNYIGQISEHGTVINKEKESIWLQSDFDERCSECKDGLICLNKVCPFKRIKRNCKRYCIKG